ncbi:hypothetical protein Dsin_029025 [Dipteronia sinensis]|uniref:Uncharacterized protein n=1 Tax=Dipteronia sinensis TaxID=43782 RepID=A0AAD9ZS96_9ROSI|nr:hypothetical protein Dsin_029025 [Dipteronia sinensis]
MEPPPFSSLKDDEVISTCNTENEPSWCPTNLPNLDQCQDLSMERVVDTSNKFTALVEKGDNRNNQCNDYSNDQCNDVDAPSMASSDQCNDQCTNVDSPTTASPDHSLWHSKIKNIDGVTVKGLSSPTESYSKKKKKKRTAKKGKVNSTQAKFRISFVYGSNDDRLRKALWQSMCSSQHGSPWIVLADFNVSRSVGESIGGCSRILGDMEEFNDCLQSLELDDLRFSGDSKGAKICWSDICLPKKEGGLGNKDLSCWNEALMIRHIWILSYGTNNLWSSWIKAYHLKDSNLWEAKTPCTCSWNWRKLLHLQPLVRPLIQYYIGNSSSTSLWCDNWHPDGPLL